MSVNVRVVLLVGYDTTLYIPCRVWNSLGLSGLQRVGCSLGWLLPEPSQVVFYTIAYYMQHGMTQLGILFPKGADDHAHFILPKEVERVLDHRGSTCTPPSISTGVKGEGWILVFHVLDIKGFVVEPVPSPAPPESGFDPKVQ
uniref:Uncharacterized protein n=1 Tax=Fagus sylvatica TaxID=28930 RepID=A0A2N9FLR0_FAGSY